MTLIYILLLTVLSGIAYHLGGLGADGAKNHPRWPSWLFNRSVRHIMCPLCACAVLSLLRGLNDLLLLSGILMGAACSCYWNFLHKRENKTSWNWFLHGLFIGLSILPYGIATNHVCSVTLYSLSLGLSMMALSDNVDIAWVEECGRGALIIALIYIVVLF